MAKKDKTQDPAPEIEMEHPFVGGEEDDLMDMEYIQDETTSSVDTHPPETKEEAEALGKEAEVDDPTPVEDPDASKTESDDAEEAVAAEAESPAEEVAEEATTEEEPVKVPKDRFDEVNERMKRAEQKAKQLEQQLESIVETKKSEPEPEPYDYETKEKEAADALLEGDNEKYAALRAEIRAAERSETLREAQQLAAQGDQQLQETLTFEEVGAKIEQEFPEFVEGSEQFMPQARDEMLDLFLGYAQSGTYTRAEALQRAADRAVRIFQIGRDETPAAPAPDNVVSMKKADPKAKAKTANAQPPVMESRAQGQHEEARRDVNSMSDEEYQALPEATKRRLRGDVI